MPWLMPRTVPDRGQRFEVHDTLPRFAKPFKPNSTTSPDLAEEKWVSASREEHPCRLARKMSRHNDTKSGTSRRELSSRQGLPAALRQIGGVE